MRFWPLVAAVVLAVATVNLARALVTRGDIGPVEYASSVVLLALLAWGVYRWSRHAVRRA